MGITPIDINNKEFKKAFRGYDIDDVDDFMDEVVSLNTITRLNQHCRIH